MPYGRDFLDTLNDLLMDGGATSKKIISMCRVCGKKGRHKSNLCAACRKAQIV